MSIFPEMSREKKRRREAEEKEGGEGIPKLKGEERKWLCGDD